MKTSSSGKKAVIPFDDKLLVDATHTDKTEMEPATKLQWIERLLKKYPLKSKEKWLASGAWQICNSVKFTTF